MKASSGGLSVMIAWWQWARGTLAARELSKLVSTFRLCSSRAPLPRSESLARCNIAEVPYSYTNEAFL